MKLTEDFISALKLVSGLFYAAAASVFALLTVYVAVPTGLYAKLPYDFWLVGFWLLVLGQFIAYKLPQLKALKVAVPVLGLWAWAVLWTATVVSYGLSFVILPYTLAILLDAVILASILQAKR